MGGGADCYRLQSLHLLDHTCTQGLVKPDIVFFGEDLPQRFHSLRLRDFSHCDLLIIMGTSLEVRENSPCAWSLKGTSWQ